MAQTEQAPQAPETAQGYQELITQVRTNWITAGLVLLIVAVGYWLALKALRRGFAAARARREGKDRAEQAIAYLSELERWLSGALKVLTLIAALTGVLWALQITRLTIVNNFFDLAYKKALSIGLIVFMSFLAKRALNFLVGNFASYYRRHTERSRDMDLRLKTLCAVLTGGGSAVIAVVAAFLILETLLESVGTVLASVGFLGIALGFGAQTLVRDLISGFFILLENQFAIGDGVRINDQWGTVERIGLRSITLRDGEGVAHLIPNGSITRVSNSTRGWSRAVVYAGVDYSGDPDKVLAALAQVGQEIRADPRFAGDILKDFEVSGPESFEDSVIYRIACPTVPARQWDIMREVRYRVWKTFAREGLPLKKGPGYSAPVQTQN